MKTRGIASEKGRERDGESETEEEEGECMSGIERRGTDSTQTWAHNVSTRIMV
jgi:hypothetical protein